MKQKRGLASGWAWARCSWPSRRDWYRIAVRARRFVVHNVLRADDPPHRLALAVAIALFVTFTPTIGFRSVLVVLLAWMFGANKLVGLPLVWISNPATFVPIDYPSYLTGSGDGFSAANRCR